MTSTTGLIPREDSPFTKSVDGVNKKAVQYGLAQPSLPPTRRKKNRKQSVKTASEVRTITISKIVRNKAEEVALGVARQRLTPKASAETIRLYAIKLTVTNLDGSVTIFNHPYQARAARRRQK